MVVHLPKRLRLGFQILAWLRTESGRGEKRIGVTAVLSELLWVNRGRLLQGKPVRGLRQIDVASNTDQENRRSTTLDRSSGDVRAGGDFGLQVPAMAVVDVGLPELKKPEGAP